MNGGSPMMANVIAPERRIDDGKSCRREPAGFFRDGGRHLRPRGLAGDNRVGDKYRMMIHRSLSNDGWMLMSSTFY
jgi:hypothetical protein